MLPPRASAVKSDSMVMVKSRDPRDVAGFMREDEIAIITVQEIRHNSTAVVSQVYLK